MAREVGEGKMWIACSIRQHTTKSSLYAKKFADISYRSPVIYSPFCPKFRCHGSGGQLVKILIAAFDGPTSNPPDAKISQISLTVAKL